MMWMWFVKPTIVFCYFLSPIIKDRVTLEDQDGISGFGNPIALGPPAGVKTGSSLMHSNQSHSTTALSVE